LGEGGLAVQGALPPRTKLWLLSDGRAGHEAQTLAIAQALGLAPDIKRLAPRKLFATLAPFGPIDPRDKSLVAPPYPDIVLAAGRRTIPALRQLKRTSGRSVFTVYVNAPATGPRTADLIVAPLHDGFFARNAVTPLTPANRLTPALLNRLRENPDPRVAALPKPRAALLIGGDSRHFKFTPADAAALAGVTRTLFAHGLSVMATASRRTPAFVVEALAEALAGGPGFLWDGAGENPYLSMLANADRLIVTADSVNMVGEAAATGAPVHVFAPSGGHRKITAYLASLEAHGAARPWREELEDWRYEPLNSTPMIAKAIVKAFAIHRGAIP
jgi:mitochondrial fission protein ELM1